ncbi:hypothetical protein HDU79_002151, partial [Rhizoclosmatium sp. JEL0117]
HAKWLTEKRKTDEAKLKKEAQKDKLKWAEQKRKTIQEKKAKDEHDEAEEIRKHSPRIQKRDHIDDFEKAEMHKQEAVLMNHKPKWMNLSDYYRPEFQPFVYQFDSLKELAGLINTPVELFDYKNVKVEGPKFYKKIREQSMVSWIEMFHEMGYTGSTILLSQRPDATISIVCFMLTSNIIQLVRVVLTSPDVASSAQSTKDGLLPKKLKQDKLLNYSTVTLEPWKHKDSLSSFPRITYFNGHRGCNENFHGVMLHFGLNFKVLNPRKVTRYGMRQEDAQRLIDSGYISSLCSQSDVIVIADTLPDARGILLSLLETDSSRRCQSNVVVELTNRFDWMIDQHEDYYEMLRRLIDDPPQNLFWTANNPFEEVYFRMRVGKAPRFRLLRSLGVWNVDPQGKGNSSPSNSIKKSGKVAGIKIPEAIDSISVIKNEEPINKPKVMQLLLFQGVSSGLVQLKKKYGGPEVLLHYKAFLDFPYQVSVMKFYENIAHGVPQVLPTPRFLKAIIGTGYHHYFFDWINKLEEAALFVSDPGKHAKLTSSGEFERRIEPDEDLRSRLSGPYQATWTELCDYYRREFTPFVYYFDSFKELRELTKIPFEKFDTKNVRIEGPKYYNLIRNESLSIWKDLFMEMGFDLRVK